MNQENCAFSQAEVIAPFLEQLRSKNRKFHWDETLERLWRELKRVMVQRIKEGVKTYEISRKTFLATDYSKKEINYCFISEVLQLPWRG